MGKPTTTEVKPLVDLLYQRNSVGCCLHVVLDDGNIDDQSVAWCRDEAQRQGHADCFLLANTMLEMSRTQRKKLGKS